MCFSSIDRICITQYTFLKTVKTHYSVKFMALCEYFAVTHEEHFFVAVIIQFAFF